MILALSTPLESRGDFTVSQLTTAVVSQSNRTRYTNDEVRYLWQRVVYWCGIFGFNHDLVAAQIIHETNYLRFTGDVAFGQHNFAGLGATGGVPGHRFPLLDGLIQDDGIEAGVLAVVAHHAAYRWGERGNWPEPLWQYAGEHVDPRYDEVLDSGNAGRMHVLGDYRGTWAVPGRTYPESLITRSRQIDAFPKGADSMWGQIPGYLWTPADSDHYSAGRGRPISGIAHHHTVGRNSLPWLTRTSGRDPDSQPVSANFLIRYDPDAPLEESYRRTLRDQFGISNPPDGIKGFQLVRIEDRAWTTGELVNQYTVSSEWERFDQVVVPEAAYREHARLDRELARYVREQGLGEILLNRDRIRGHREWVGASVTACPGNLSVDEIVRRAQADAPAPAPEVLIVPGNPFGAVPIVFGFRAFFLEQGAVRFAADAVLGGLALFGYPKAAEYATDFGSAQEFEKGVMTWHAGQPRPWDIQMLQFGAPLPAPKAA